MALILFTTTYVIPGVGVGVAVFLTALINGEKLHVALPAAIVGALLWPFCLWVEFTK